MQLMQTHKYEVRKKILGKEKKNNEPNAQYK